ncbi:MAG: transcriptional repressor [Lachnospiraceae bacterium]|nr:transcriptional repressor [Lachnospiraceae bacterium]MDE6252226.1 transcriptional repressor [Lachnospiraceae bacterium]
MQQDFEKTQMKKEIVIQKLRERGCRITKQRLILLDIILEENCSCCKEIYYKASRMDDKIGSATVYRMINILEEIGAINRKNMYRISCDTKCGMQDTCTIHFDDDSVIELSANKYNQIIQTGLSVCGYVSGKKVRNVVISQCTDSDK